MSDVTVESLQLEVQSSADGAARSIDTLTSTLGKLKSATKGIGLTGVVNQIRNLDSALKSVDGSSADKIDKLATSLSKLNGLGSIKLSSSVANQLKNIGSAATSLNGVDFSSIGKLSTALTPLGNIGKATGLNSTFNALKKLPEVAKSLAGLDLNSFTSQIQQLSNALAPLANQFNTVATAFTRLPTNIRRVVTATNSLTQTNSRASTSYINLWAKLRMARVAIQSIGNTIASWLHTSNQYIEDMNLFNVALGEYASEAQKYAEQVGEVLGIDPGEFMRNQGVFNTIISGFGVASDKAYLMSKNLTQLGYDISSFFNISFEDAMQKLQSGISGELEPLRRLGYDLSVARLQEEALALGIEKKVSAMTQAEKSQLRYYAIMTQVTTAQGDMARTLNAPANQLRVLQAQVTQCARALGNIFIPALNAVLPYAIALAKIVRMLANSIASLFGFKLPEVDYSGISAGASAVGDLADNAGDASDGLGKAGKAAKKLKNALLGIDELNVLSKDDSSSGSGSGSGAGIGGNDLGIDLPTYDFLGNAVSSKIDAIVDKLKEWLGLNEEINSLSDLLHTRLGRILTTVGAIALGLAAWKISKGVLSALKYMQNLKNLGLDNAFTITVGISLLVTGVALEWAGIIDAIKYELNKMNFAQIIAGGLLTIGGSSILGKGIAGWIMSSFADSSIAAALTTAASNLGLGTATAAGAAIGAGIGGIIAGIPAYFTGIYDALKNGLNWLNGLLIPAGSTAAAAGIGAIIGACGGPIGAGIGALIGLAVGLVTDGIIAIKEHWSEITTFLNKFFTVTVPGMWNKFKTWVQKLPSKVSEFFSNLWKPIENYDWYGLGKNIGTWFGNAVKSGIELVTVKIPNWFSSTWEAVKKAFSTFFTQTLPKFFTQTIPELWNTISEAFVTFFIETLPEKLSDIGTWFHDVGKAVWDGMVEGWNAGIKAIGDFIKGFVDGVKEALGIHSPSTVFAEIGRFCIEGLFNGLGETVKGIGKWVKKNIITPVKNAFTKNPVALAIKNNTSDLWNKVTNWWSSETKDGVSVKTAVQLAKDGWDTVSGWIGKIPVVKQFITLAKHLWTSVKDWVGKIPTLSQFIALAKEKWESVRDWIGNIPVLEQGIKLVKSLWSTVKGWVGNIPTLDQGIALAKRTWTTVKNWVGNIPTLSQYIALAKQAWSTVKGWIGNIPVLSQGIALAKHLWTTVRNWIGNIPVLSQAISLIKSGWSKVSSWVWSFGSGVISQGVSLARNGWSTVASWVRTQIGGAVDITVNLISKWKGRIKEFFGLSGGGVISAGGGIKMFASGGIITPNMWKAMPKYAGGTNRAHGSMFVAGESGAELVGHINGTTEVLNRFQLAEVMHSSIVSGMAQFARYWQSMSHDLVTCANGVINAVMVGTAGINDGLALASASGYDPSYKLAQSVYEENQKSYRTAESSMYEDMRDFYREFMESSINRMVVATERQADKKEQTIVKVGNRTINDAVTTQKEANGFSFTE
jgi:hypothetical protein